MTSEQQYIELYEQARQLICRNAPEVMNAVRDDAFSAFKAQGFPSQKVEHYRYTDIQRLFAPDYGLNLKRLQIPADPYEVFSCDVPNLSTSLYFMVNDSLFSSEEREARSAKVHQASPKLPDGMVVDSMQHVFASPSPLATRLAAYYARLAKPGEDAVTALNTMLAQDGLVIYVPRNVKTDRAIQVINILKATPGNALRQVPDLMVNRRVLIVLEEGAEVKLLFCDHAADDRNFLATQVVEAYVGENARLDLYCLEETHDKNVRLNNVYIDQQTDSHVTYSEFTLQNGITRNQLRLTLSGQGAQCNSYGCAIADKQQHVDNNTLITHRVPHGTSNQLYKYLFLDEATGAFAGRVLVEHNAQKTVSQMTNRNLCTTPQARMYTQPMLEIYADDVKCAHGSTVGQLDQAALFYMRQRGISEHEARTLLQVAFIREVIDQVELQPLRDRLHLLTEKRIRGQLDQCDRCRLCK